jgi:sec-independent protein translocase protein TatB
MFDFSFWELSLVGLITLVVVGPDKIPSLARKTGVYAGKLKKFLNKIKADIDNELNLEELKELKELSLKGQSNHLNDFFENSQEASNDIENEVELIKKIGSEPEKDMKMPVDSSKTEEVEVDLGFSLEKYIESGPIAKDTDK